MTNLSEIQQAIDLLSKEGYNVEKDIKHNVIHFQQDEKDHYTYRFILRKTLIGKQAYDIVDAIENVLSGNPTNTDVAVKELLAASIERMQKVEKDAKDELHKAYEDLITNLNNYKFK